MNRKFAQILSVILHPVLMPTYALLFIFLHGTYFAYTVAYIEKVAVFSIIFLNTLLFPVFISYFLVKKGLIRSFEMEKREERLMPYISNFILMLVSAFMLYRLHLPKVFFLLTIGAAAALAIAIIINFKWKISIHMIGIGGMIGTFFGLSTFLLVDLRVPILFSIVLAGFLGSARLSLKAHEPSQIYAGFFVGFFCEYLLLSV
jgi:hypothetical protein